MSKSQFVCWLHVCDLSTICSTGGKNSRLGILIKGGFPVPHGFAIKTAAYKTFLQQGPGELIQRILDSVNLNDISAVSIAAKNVRSVIQEYTLPPEIKSEIAQFYDELSCEPGRYAQRPRSSSNLPLPVALRSSATTECLHDRSYAGQQETVLGVQGIENVFAHLKSVWSSLFSAQAISYRYGLTQDLIEPAMSVCVQHMLDSCLSGVMFTLNPKNGDRSKICIEAVKGLGDKVVSGEVNPEWILLDKVTLEVLERRASWYISSNGDIVQGDDYLTCAQIRSLALLAKDIEVYNAEPQDIEWAIDPTFVAPNHIAVLQSRPETAWRQTRATIAPPNYTTISMANILRQIVN